MSIIALGAQRETWLVTFLVCVKNYKHLRRIKKTLTLYALLSPRVPTAALKLSMVLDRATMPGMLFHTLTADGKKESLKQSMRVAGWMYRCAERTAGWRYASAGIAIRPLTILYIMVALASVLRLSRVAHPRDCNMAVTLQRRLKLLQTNLAALLWTISIFVMVWGSHTVEAYSMIGLTKVL